MTEEKEKKGKSGEISRREFLKDAGLVVGGAAIGSAVLLAACKGAAEATETVTKTATVTGAPGGTVTVTGAPGGTKTVTTTMTAGVAAQANVVKLTVNGWAYELQVQPNWTLLDVLRDKLGLTGTKIGCDLGACGMCNVLVDGKALLSCMMLAIECEGKKITTVEGLAVGGKLDRVQQAFVDGCAIECGFCTPGMVMAAEALLVEKPNPTKDEVKRGLSGNLCCCGSTYHKAIEAVLAAAKK